MKNFKLKKVILPILLIAVIGGSVYIAKADVVKKENAKQTEQLNKQKEDEKKANAKRVAYDKRVVNAKAIEDEKVIEGGIKKSEDIGTGKMDEAIIYDRMHRMINTKIIAEDGLTWDNIVITSEGLENINEAINNNNYADKEKLLVFIKAWKNKDFSDGVAQHQYLWHLLDGNVGKAIGLK